MRQTRELNYRIERQAFDWIQIRAAARICLDCSVEERLTSGFASLFTGLRSSLWLVLVLHMADLRSGNSEWEDFLLGEEVAC